MTTPHVLDRLPHWVEGDLPGQELAEIERHLAECHSCRTAAQDLTTSQVWLREALASPFDAVDQERLRRRVMARVRSVPTSTPIQQLTLRRGLLAACAATLLVATLVWRQVRSRPLASAGPAIEASPAAAEFRPPTPPTPAAAQPTSTSSRPARIHPIPAAPARIEFQTSDPAIRIIWLAQATTLSGATPSPEEES